MREFKTVESRKKNPIKGQIKEFFANTKVLKRNNFVTWSSYVDFQKREWISTYLNLSRNPIVATKNELLNPVYQEFTLKHAGSFDVKALRKSHQGIRLEWIATKGLWSVVTNTQKDGSKDFTICVSVGGMNSFHSDAIKYRIETAYGADAYNQWRRLALEDLDSLEYIIREIREMIGCTHASVICSDSALRLCERVGIPIKNQFAFLLPIVN